MGMKRNKLIMYLGLMGLCDALMEQIFIGSSVHQTVTLEKGQDLSLLVASKIMSYVLIILILSKQALIKVV